MVFFFSAQDIKVDSGALVDVSRRGWPAGEGPSPGIYGVKGGAGASHGGRGGKGTSVDHSNPALGNVTSPLDYGSGGSVLQGTDQVRLKDDKASYLNVMVQKHASGTQNEQFFKIMFFN